MIKPRIEIEKAIISYLKENFGNKNRREEIIDFFVNKGFNRGYATSMLNLNQLPEMWSDMDLGVMTLIINNLKGLDINVYYTKNEIESFNNYVIINKKSNDDTLIFENAFPIGYYTENEEPVQFNVGSVSIQKLAEYFAEKKIGYNPEIQRDLIRLTDKKGEVTEKINVDSSKKAEIAEKTLNHTMFSNAVVLNVMKTGQEQVKYNWDSHKLIIENNENTSTFCIDGYNRSTAFNEALQTDPNVIFYIPVTVCIFNKDRAAATIADIDKQKPISKSKAKVLSNSNDFMNIAKIVNKTEERNEMFNKIAEDNNELKIKKDKYCTYEVFSEAIKINFFDEDAKIVSKKKITPRKIDNISEFLIKGFNEILGELFEKYDSIEDIKEKTVYLENNAFIGYIALLSDIQFKDNWKSLLQKSLDNINFSRNNADWTPMELFSTKINKTVVRKISNYFVEGSVK